MTANPSHRLQFDQPWPDLQWSTDSNSSEALYENGNISQAHFILNRLFQDFAGSFAVRLWNGSMLYIGNGTPAFTFCLEQASVLRNMILFSDPARLAEAYFSGEVQILGDFHAAMQLRYYFESLSFPLHEKLGLVFRALTLADSHIEHTDSTQSLHTPAQNESKSISLDYAAPADFYHLWLDDHMLYSCAYFGDASQDLMQAQLNQLDLVCLKLHLQHGESLLDIGGGWGGLACWAARNYGVFVHSITQSPEQYAYAMEEVKRQGLEKLVTIELCHYRDLPDVPRYNKVVSIGVCDNVGEQNLPAYLDKVHAVLKPGGLFLDHHVTLENPGRQHQVPTEFINRQMFPDGELSTLPQLETQLAAAKFEICKVDGMRRHHALTLRRWVQKLEQRHKEVTQIVGDRTYRIWRFYMTACAIQFEQGLTAIYQILAVRR